MVGNSRRGNDARQAIELERRQIAQVGLGVGHRVEHGTRIGIGTCVCEDRGSTGARKMSRHRRTRRADAEYERRSRRVPRQPPPHVVLGHHHRIFRLERPTSTRITVMIQKRTMTLGSGQPLSS